MKWIALFLLVIFLVANLSSEAWAVIGAVFGLFLAGSIWQYQIKQKHLKEIELKKQKQREEIQKIVGLSDEELIKNHFSYPVTVSSRVAIDTYNALKFFKAHPNLILAAEIHIETNKDRACKLEEVLNNKCFALDSDFRSDLETLHNDLSNYRVYILYKTKKTIWERNLYISREEIIELKEKPYLLIGKAEYDRQLKQMFANRQHQLYDRINDLIDLANGFRKKLILKGAQNKLDELITRIYGEVLPNVRKMKSVDPAEWELLEKPVREIEAEAKELLELNKKILNYYSSPDFEKIKSTCQAMINSQKEFNDYIKQQVDSISCLLGKRTDREETIFEDQNRYVRTYKKTVSPFTAELSAQVFSSAENNVMKYLVKTFYPNKAAYPQQIKNLYKLVEELETLEDARKIIENYKTEYKQYIGDVPNYIMKYDSDGFYARLGFAQVDENSLNVKYVFAYTSSGGKARRSFSVPMTLEKIEELINILKSKLSKEAFIKEQRMLMTPKLRESIKERDHHTCCLCGNSIYKERNLLLEIDHIIPVSKGGETVPSNLQTLCWKCNRSKSNKLSQETFSE